jgi:hypothetical protein
MQKKLLLSMVVTSLLLNAQERTKTEDLEKRVQVLEKALNAQKKEKLKKALNGGDSFNQKSFIPDISLILSGSAISRNINNDVYEGYGIDGFVTQTNNIPFNKNRGFNFNYAELGMHSDVGPYFESDAIFHLHPNAFEIEEAYITTKKLPANLDVKAGKFRSGFGRINAIHRHAQHFTEQPLVYEAMLGVDGINDAGVAMHWVAPTDIYLMGGIEAMQGSNALSFGKSSSNNLYVSYLKSGFDLGESTSILAGTSVASGKTQNSKESNLYGGELTLKHIIDSYSSLSWQSEYLYRDRESVKQAGYYTQLLYQKDSNWEFGGRYDALNKNVINQPDDLKKYSAIVTYKPFEFSKLRLQATHDKSKSFGGVRRTENQVMLEFLVETGAHGAHAF